MSKILVQWVGWWFYKKKKKNAKISHKGKVRFFRWKVRFRKELGHLPQNNLGQRADLWTIFPTLVILTKRFSKGTNLHIWWYRQKFQLRWPFCLFLNSFFIWNWFFSETKPRTKISYSSFSTYFSTQNFTIRSLVEEMRRFGTLSV